jgi:hypothetical protein
MIKNKPGIIFISPKQLWLLGLIGLSIVFELSGCNEMPIIIPNQKITYSITQTQPNSTISPTMAPTTKPSSTPTPKPSLPPTITPSQTKVYAPHLEDDLTKTDNYADISIEDITSGRLSRFIQSQLTTNPFPNGKNCFYGQNSELYGEHRSVNVIICLPRSQEEFDEFSINVDKRPIRTLFGFKLNLNSTEYYIFAQAYAHDDGSYGLLFIAWPQEHKKGLSTEALEINWGYLVPLWNFHPEKFPNNEQYSMLTKSLKDINFNHKIMLSLGDDLILNQRIPEDLSRYLFYADWITGWQN